MNAKQIEHMTLDNFDRSVMELSKTEYKDCLENLIDQFQSRLDCVEEEIEAEVEDE